MRALGNLAHHVLEARIVLIAACAVGLHDQRAFAHHRGAAQHLHVRRLRQNHRARDGENHGQQIVAAGGRAVGGLRLRSDDAEIDTSIPITRKFVSMAVRP